LGDGTLRYYLRDGRMVMTRPATHRLSNGEPTLEIFEPAERAGRWTSTDLFRYPPGR
jgi:hypothetical protein